MRVLVVVHGFPPAAQGGSEIYALEHARTLRRIHGDDVRVLTRESEVNTPEFAVRVEERDGLSIAWINNTFQAARTFEDTYRNDCIGGIAAGLIDEFKPDVAHIHHLTCLSTTIVDILAERRVPCFFTLHDYWLMCHRGQLLDTRYQVCEGPQPSGCRQCLGPWAGVHPTASRAAPMFRAIERRLPGAVGRRLAGSSRRLAGMLSEPGVADEQAARRFEHMKHVCAGVTRFLAPSRSMRDRFIQFGVPPERITVSEYGFDHAPFREITRTVSSHLRLGFLGSLMVSKAPDVLLTAFRELPEGAASVDLIGAYCAYHGDDGYRQRLAALVDRAGISVHPPIAHDRVAEALASIDALVVPSIWPENSPLVIREAFLAGVPVVASRIGGIPECVIDGRNGLLFRAGDAADLARVLLRLLREPELLKTLRAGIPPVRTIEDDVRATREIYADAIGRAGPAVPTASAKAAPQSGVVAAIVLNYGTPDDTLLAVKSLRASRRPIQDITVVDNSANGDCRAALRTVASEITFVQTGTNLGFSGGMNVGIRRALARGAGRVLLVNSDMIVPPDCLDRLEACLERMPRAGIAGPAVLSRSDPGRVASLGMKYLPSTGRMRHRAAGAEVRTLPMSGDTVVDGVSGCLMLVRREVFDAIGLLDEEYFFSFEDLDFCLKARRAGFTTALASDAVAYHEGSRSIGAGSPDRLYYGARNHLRMAERADPAPRPHLSAFRFSSILLLSLAHAALSRGGTLPSRLLAVAHGTRDYLDGKFGDRRSR